MEIRGRMSRERERCIGMTEEERSWRARFLKDQILTEREPVQVKELNFRNPIRSFYARPLDKLILDPLTPKWVRADRNGHVLNEFWKCVAGILLLELCNCLLLGNGTT